MKVHNLHIHRPKGAGMWNSSPGGRGICRVTWLNLFALILIFMCIISVSVFLQTAPSGNNYDTNNHNIKRDSAWDPEEDRGRRENRQGKWHVKRPSSSHETGDSASGGRDQDENHISLVHARAVIPTQYYMKKRAAMERYLSQALAEIKPLPPAPSGSDSRDRGNGEGSQRPSVSVVVVDVAYEGVVGGGEPLEGGEGEVVVPARRGTGAAILLDSLKWSIGNKLLTKEQKMLFLKDNPDDTLYSPPIMHVLQEAHKYAETYALGRTYIVYTEPTTSFKPDFYTTISDLLVDTSVRAIALSDSDKHYVYVGFVFPLDWVPLLQLAGVLVDGPEESIGELFVYNLAVLSESEKGTLLRKEYGGFLEHGGGMKKRSDASRELGAAWHQLQTVDAYWALHPNRLAPDWIEGLTTPFCPCDGGSNQGCPESLSKYFDTQTLFKELSRSCKLADGIRKDNSKESLTRIKPQLHPSFVYGDFRDFRNPDSCSEKFAGFREGLLRVGFVSYPRSGNTWARRIIERATTVLTGSVYTDQLLVDGGLLGEGYVDDVVMVKDHWPFDFNMGKNKKVLDWASHIVWIIRNPFKSIESYYHYLYSGFRHSVSKEIDKEKWRAWVVQESKAWVNWQTRWMNINEEYPGLPVLQVSYENFVKNPVAEVKRILEFIHFEVNEERIQCAVQTNCKEACRVGKNSTSVDIYGPEETEIMMSTLGKFMKQFGYEGKPKKS